MKFAKIVFLIAGVLGLIELAPLYLIFDVIGRQDPPPITHPGFYYGFIGVALAWQIGFIVISRDPVRLRPVMIPAVIEKFIYAITFITLYLQSRIHASDLAFGVVDLLFGILFLTAFFKTAN
jgi:vacuolar-type H+-ATPase subunit I/STV1